MSHRQAFIENGGLKAFTASIFLVSFVLILSNFFIGKIVSAEPIHILTGELPPYSYHAENSQVGLGSAIVKEICKRTGDDYQIESLPWSRAIVFSRQDEDRLIYPLGRTAEREENYLWIGPILKDRFVFFVRKSDERMFSSLDDFRGLNVGVVLRTPPLKRLQNLNFTGIDTVRKESLNIKKLLRNRIDAWYAAELIMMHTIESSGFDGNAFKLGFADIDLVFYIGASKNMMRTATRWQNVLEEMKSDGTYERLIAQPKENENDDAAPPPSVQNEEDEDA